MFSCVLCFVVCGVLMCVVLGRVLCFVVCGAWSCAVLCCVWCLVVCSVWLCVVISCVWCLVVCGDLLYAVLGAKETDIIRDTHSSPQRNYEDCLCRVDTGAV